MKTEVLYISLLELNHQLHSQEYNPTIYHALHLSNQLDNGNRAKGDYQVEQLLFVDYFSLLDWELL